MELIANFPCATGIVPLGSLGAQVRRGFIVKVTYDVQEDKRLTLASASEPIRHTDSHEGDVFLPRDVPMAKDGVDLIFLGNAIAQNAPVAATKVDISLSSNWRIQLDVVGDRRWQRTWNGYDISEPEPFSRMPLTWPRAYGGFYKDGNDRHMYVSNPEGRGYVPPITEPEIEGVTLPNIEWPDSPIRRWTDRPTPAGCAYYSMFWGLRLSEAMEKPERRGDPSKIRPRAFNTAHPRFIREKFPDREWLRVSGMTATPFEAYICAPRIDARVSQGARSHNISLQWDELCTRPERAQVTFVGRAWLPEGYDRRAKIVLDVEKV